MLKRIILPFVLLLLSLNVYSQYPIPEKMGWWHEARLGMFIHFGSYSHLERGEWVFSTEGWAKWAYQQQCSAQFNPYKFNARHIVSMARKAGMKYLVITAKHHEGFAMWNTQVQSFKDSVGRKTYSLQAYTPVKRDLLMELKHECGRQGIRFCLYYSILDWNHKSQRISKGKDVFSAMASWQARTAYIADMKLQLKELLERYNPYVMWFDGDWCSNPSQPTLADWWTSADGADLYAYLLNIKPDLIVNERVKRHAGIGDFECSEQSVPEKPLPRMWETCATLNGAWGYDKSKDSTFRTARSLIADMMKTLSRDGNYLLNVGPRGDGSIDENTQKLLSDIGKWTKKYKDIIYGVERNPYGEYANWGEAVRKGNRVYLVLSGEPSRTIELPHKIGLLSKAYMYDSKKMVAAENTKNTLSLVLPASAYDANEIKVVVLEYSAITAAQGNPN